MQDMQPLMHDMQSNRQDMHPSRPFLRAEQVSQVLGVDRSTVYRMAESGRLPATKVGRQWRFSAEQIAGLTETHGGDLVANRARGRRDLLRALPYVLPLIELAADLLGVMIVLTDMAGEPVTEILNPCPWLDERSDDPVLMSQCLADWKQLADDPDFEIRFRKGPLDFDCARAFVRIGPLLVGMLVAGGATAHEDDERALHRLNAEGRARVLASLSMVAARISRIVASLSSELDMSSTA
ncbi:MAG: helix-turn-helix domain-containing protein [Acidimicrobiales bacterium]|jgi:excisionase family DNA binding protein